MRKTPFMRVRKVEEVEVSDLEQRLAAARDNSRKSLAQICREAGITPMYWYKLVSGKQDSIPLETLEKLSEALETDFNIAFN